jgi:hypothetical protein
MLGPDSILPGCFPWPAPGAFAFGGGWGVLASLADVVQRQDGSVPRNLRRGWPAAIAPGSLALVADTRASRPVGNIQAALPAGCGWRSWGACLAVLGLLLPG